MDCISTKIECFKARLMSDLILYAGIIKKNHPIVLTICNLITFVKQMSVNIWKKWTEPLYFV